MHAAPAVKYYIHNLARKRPKFRQKLDNKYLDFPTKRAAMAVSASVVALVSFIGIVFLIHAFLMLYIYHLSLYRLRF